MEKAWSRQAAQTQAVRRAVGSGGDAGLAAALGPEVAAFGSVRPVLRLLRRLQRVEGCSAGLGLRSAPVGPLLGVHGCEVLAEGRSVEADPLGAGGPDDLDALHAVDGDRDADHDGGAAVPAGAARLRRSVGSRLVDAAVAADDAGGLERGSGGGSHVVMVTPAPRRGNGHAQQPPSGLLRSLPGIALAAVSRQGGGELVSRTAAGSSPALGVAAGVHGHACRCARQRPTLTGWRRGIAGAPPAVAALRPPGRRACTPTSSAPLGRYPT